MKRKVIQIAGSTQLVSLPRKWAIEQGIRKGDELDVKPDGNILIVSPDSIESKVQEITIDVSGLDRTSIFVAIRCAYKSGFDLINVKFSKSVTKYLRLDEEVKVISAIHEEVNRLIGVEIVQQKENFCVIKALSDLVNKEFDTALRRVFLLLSDATKDLITGIKQNDQVLLDSIYERHDIITKFISYCLRLLNKSGYKSQKETLLFYQILADLDKLTDIIKWIARLLKGKRTKLSENTLELCEELVNLISLYHNLFYKFNMDTVVKIYGKRNEHLERRDNLVKKISNFEVRFIDQVFEISDLMVSLLEAKISLNYLENI